MKIGSGQQSSLSGVKAYGAAISATAHNVANLNTEDFSPLDRRFTDQRPGVKVTLSRRDPPTSPMSSRRNDLSQSMVRLVGDGHAYKANLTALQQQMDLQETAIDILDARYT
tara:strand:- start:153 stop:488 length:336 start_codon:yes stop_codon:yes gene_type:complete